MIRRLSGSIVVLILLLVAVAPLSAEICAVDDAPAATLLLPYFEVDLGQGPFPESGTTLFSVVNVTAEPTLVKAVLWTDMGIPTFDFEIYLTGYDVFSANLRDLFILGQVPVTGTLESPQGIDSAANTPFPDCGPTSFGGKLSPGFLEDLVAAHTGAPSDLFGGLCGAQPSHRASGSGIKARGFLTLDVVRRCSPLGPTTPGYFGPEGVADFDNRLIGDFFFVDATNDFAQGEQLVRLEASADRFGPGDRTFYAPFVKGDGSDGREPLPTLWASRVLNGGGFSGGTQILAWRGLLQPTGPFDCSTSDSLPTISEVYSFDEEENSVLAFPQPQVITPPVPIDEFNPIPFAAGRLDAGDVHLHPAPFGWLTFDMATSIFPKTLTAVDQPSFFSQAWIGTTFDASGRFSVGFGASPLSPPCNVGGCLRGQPQAGTEICVLGTPSAISSVDATLSTGDMPTFEVRTNVCADGLLRSNSLSRCSATTGAGLTYEVEATFCVPHGSVPPVTESCRFILKAACLTDQPLQEGSYTVQYGTAALEFQVPSTIPLGGLCVSVSD